MKTISSLLLSLFLIACGGSPGNSSESTKTEDQVVEEIISEIESEQLELKKDTEKSISEIDSLLNSI